MDRASWYRNRARRSRSGCLDMSHRHPDLDCPYCNRSDAVIDAFARQHARTVAEDDLSGFGWYS
jgi:hypothetical protein